MTRAFATKRPAYASGQRDPVAQLRALGRMAPGVMNKTEAAYADELDRQLRVGEITWWKFGGMSLCIAPRTHVRIDFAVLRADGVLELRDVKGAAHLVEEDANAKYKVARSQYPMPIRIVWPRTKKDGGGWAEKEIGA